MFSSLLDFLETLAVGLAFWAMVITAGVVVGFGLFLLGEVL